MRSPIALGAVNAKLEIMVCTLNDGMQKIYPELEKADLIAFGMPFFGPWI